MRTTLMTDEEYVSKSGTRCPSCESDQLSGDSVEVDGGTATQVVSCIECGATWTDCYKLQGYMDFSSMD